jgi:periplasmic copper chaperone A
MRKIPLVAAVLSLALPAAAQAHVTVHPSTVPAGGEDTLLSIRVPNEMDNASVTKVDLLLPPGFVAADFQPVPGWTTKVTKVKLPTPVKTDDGTITERVGRITWTNTNKADAIPPEAFQDFNLSVLVPGKAGDTLTFKALQTYSDGHIVRWIGPESSDNPAPTIKVTAASGGAATPMSSSTPAATVAAASNGNGASNGLAIVALIVGVLGLLAGIGGLLAARRAAPGRPAEVR